MQIGGIVSGQITASLGSSIFIQNVQSTITIMSQQDTTCVTSVGDTSNHCTEVEPTVTTSNFKRDLSW